MSSDISERETQEYLKSLTVLYVEDERDFREQCSEFLIRLVGVLVTAQNGESGLDAWRQHKPDIIITDIQMPAMDGLAMLQEIRKIDREVPVIVLSAFEESKHLKRSVNLGVYGYVVKPVNVSRFTETLLACARSLKTEAALLESRILLNSIINAIPDAIYEKDLEGRYKLFNAAAERFARKRAADVLGRDDLALFPAVIAREFMEMDKKVIEGRELVTSVEHVTNADGVCVSFLATKGPLLDPDGKLIGLFGISRDITEQLQAKKVLLESEAKFRALFEQATVPLALASDYGQTIEINQCFTTTFGYTADDIHTVDIWMMMAFTDEDNRRILTTAWDAALSGAFVQGTLIANNEYSITCKDGTVLTVLISVGRMPDNTRLVTFVDITERKQAETALQERNRELDCLYSIISLSNIPDLPFDELLKRAVKRIPPAWQFPDITEACIEIGGRIFKTARFKETPWILTHDIIAKENKVGKVMVCCLEKRAFLPEERALLSAIAENLGLIVLRDLYNETISRIIVTDELTGLNNRRFFNESFVKAVSAARRHKQPLSLISIDLDHFKNVNDTFGHSIGDLVLKEFSTLLKMMVRTEDIACRLGGEEFMVLLPNTTCEDSVTLAERMCRSIEQYPRMTTPAVTASFGVAQLQTGEDEETLLKRVDAALYQAKNEGRNRVVMWSSPDHTTAKKNIETNQFNCTLV